MKRTALSCPVCHKVSSQGKAISSRTGSPVLNISIFWNGPCTIAVSPEKSTGE